MAAPSGGTVLDDSQLLKSVQNGSLELLKDILHVSYGNKTFLNVHHKKSGDSVLNVASRNGHLHILKFLVECKADLELANFDGKKALHEAAQFSHIGCISFLIGNGAEVDSLKRGDWTPLMLACTKGYLEAIKILIESGANPELKNKDGWNCFHIACREGHGDIIRYLLDVDSTLWNTESKNGRTPLHTVALHGHDEVMGLLHTRASYSPDVADSCGTTPLMDAARAGFIKAAEKLLTLYKSRIDAVDNMGRQCIHLAAQSDCCDMITFLAEKQNINVNIQSTVSGVTPLHLACKEGKVHAAEKLISLGADVHIMDNKGRTALHLAAGSQSMPCVELLVNRGAYDFEDSNGCMAHSLARSSEMKEMLENSVHHNVQRELNPGIS